MTRPTASRTAFRLVLLLTLLAAPGQRFLARQAPAQAAPDRLLITGSRILDTRSGRYVAAPAVVVVGDRVDAILTSVPGTIPAGTRRVDVPGTTLVPGLGDMFAAAAPDGSADADFYYAMALAHGVTSFRVVGARLPWAASQRERSRRGDILAPRLWVGGNRLDQQGTPSFTVQHVRDAASAQRAVAQQRALGGEWVAVAANTSPEVYRAIVRAGRAETMRVSGEPGVTPVSELIRLAVDAIDRVGFFVRSRDEAAKELPPGTNASGTGDAADELWVRASAADLRPVLSKAAKRPALAPMLASFAGVLDADSLKQDPALALLSTAWRDDLLRRSHPAGWAGAKNAARAAEARGRLAAAFAAAGVPIVTGVDAESSGYNIPGAGVHRELSLLVAAGLSPAEAVKAATWNCAQMLDAPLLGQIRVGAQADLIAVEGDPLARIEDLQRIKLVIRAGEVLDRSDLLAQARRAAR
jgi:hypothetical protein